jgi:hypothetical protein
MTENGMSKLKHLWLFKLGLIKQITRYLPLMNAILVVGAIKIIAIII